MSLNEIAEAETNAKAKEISVKYGVDLTRAKKLVVSVNECDSLGITQKKCEIPFVKYREIIDGEYVQCYRIINKEKLKAFGLCDVPEGNFINMNCFSSALNYSRFMQLKNHKKLTGVVSNRLSVDKNWLSEVELEELSECL